jgi:hypothetical protein
MHLVLQRVTSHILCISFYLVENILFSIEYIYKKDFVMTLIVTKLGFYFPGLAYVHVLFNKSIACGCQHWAVYLQE